MKSVIIKIIEIYRSSLSKAWLFIPGTIFPGVCKNYPSCSDYAIQAISRDGIIRGGVKSIIRLAKCNPFFKGTITP